MGKMKEIFMELQEQYGENLETMPVDFSYDEYLNSKSQDRKSKIQKVLSTCCGADMTTLVSEDGPDYQDLGICPNCKDHCSTEN